MSRATDPRWQQLRRDKRSGLATFLTGFALVPVAVGLIMLSVPGAQSEARENPLYWLLPLPLIWWAMKIARYERSALQFIRHTQIASPLLAAGLVGVAAIRGESATPFAIATLITFVCAAAGWILYSDSMLQREGTVDE